MFVLAQGVATYGLVIVSLDHTVHILWVSDTCISLKCDIIPRCILMATYGQ